MARQYQKTNSVTMIATATLSANRFVSHSGAYATSGGGALDAIGVSEANAAVGDALSVVTGFSYIVQSSAALPEHAFVRPAADGSGRAEVGTATDHCGRVMPGGGTTAADQLAEIRILPHRHV